jgi:PAS domain S-box-containing protein
MSQPASTWRRFGIRTAPELKVEDPVIPVAGKMLHSILIGVLLWVVLDLAVGVPFVLSRKLASALLCLALSLLALAALYFLRQGRVRLAGAVFISGAWILATVLDLLSGGLSSSALLLYIALTITAGWLLGRRAGVLCGGLYLGITLAAAVAETIGFHLPRYFTPPPLGAWLLILLAVVIGTLPSIQVLRTLKEALATARDQVDKLERAEQELRESEERFRAIVDMAPDGVFFADAGGRFIEVNEAACRQLGYAREQLLQRTVFDIVPRRYAESAAAHLRSLPDGPCQYESCHLRFDGTEIPVEIGIAKITFRGQPVTVAIARDITARRQAEVERTRMEEQFRQAQKMECVGRLAGGIAHDFNNQLTVINGYGELMLGELLASDPMREFVLEIRKAGNRAAGLTQQLLAFSRKQITEPKPLNLNLIVTDAERMLQRLVGEDIRLEAKLDPALGTVLADAGQMHQVLMNLAVNARDAMPAGGSLVIETANVDLDEGEVTERLQAEPGGYVLLSVSDCGVGMDEETLSQIFEPFFTTKGMGEGTGLGLSTVYGIVRQSEGWISVDSKPDDGTTFRIYLPRTDGSVQTHEASNGRRGEQGGRETILVVEDQEEVGRLAARMLKSYGYEVLVAASGADAIRLAGQHPGSLHLMMTDVVMPGMSGRELADRQRALRPEMKVLYTSGYTDDDIARRGLLEPGTLHISKPYSPHALAEKVRAVLGPR